jgi:hypothetical protein
MSQMSSYYTLVKPRSKYGSQYFDFIKNKSVFDRFRILSWGISHVIVFSTVLTLVYNIHMHNPHEIYLSSIVLKLIY